MKTRYLAGTIAAALLCVSGASAIAQDADGDGIWQVGEFTCRDLLMRGGEERDFVLVFMHGFMSGKMNEMTFDTEALTEATDAVVESCIGNPDQPLLAAFEAARG
ncbi:HdeA/HdeB family chaperone [Aliiruegeria lutimaris]|uniref:HdeA/HdeB family protein n=1 Tax=Aliiruegeria lutimaris TaxID=571298 RepID=A0A1G8UIP2_9RHOB|nr:HdeA/HdeB family chaperone [Aliiruegeria lutimaris]SDJ53723.1 HdeA/HdeB family protein [Aliiruegeria lutimaris]